MTGLPEADTLTFLKSIYPAELFDDASNAKATSSSAHASGRPFVTLTYAQSLDGKIAGPRGAQIRLSGEESMLLTHRLRVLHDSILVGVGTMTSDDPQLTARLPHLLPISSQPRPIVLDSRFRTPTTAKLIKNHLAGLNHPPLIVGIGSEIADTLRRKEALVEAGAAVATVQPDRSGRIPLEALLNLPELGRSVMVEGGASVISSFLASGLVDLVVITIAPVLVGEGISMVNDKTIPQSLQHIATKTFGRDTVIVCKPLRRPSTSPEKSQ